MDINKIEFLETGMWEAAKNCDASRFLELVDENAVMVCGGFRCSGKEYSEIVNQFDCKNYVLSNFEIINEEDNTVQVHYLLQMDVNNQQNKDLAGTFHITTTWKCIDGSWKVIFNMDQRVGC